MSRTVERRIHTNLNNIDILIYNKYLRGFFRDEQRPKMKTYKQFTEAAALAIPAAMKMAPYVIPAAGAAANIFKGMMQSDASDKFKARQRPTGRRGKASYKDKLRAKQRKDAADKRQSADQHGPSFEKDAREAARRREQNRLTPDQRLDNLVGKAARELGIKLPEGYKGQRKEDSLNARYKDLQNPKDPREQMVRDAIKLRLKKV